MSKKEVVPKKASSPRKAASQKPPTLVQKFCLLYENNLALPYFVWFLNAFNLGAIDRLASKHATDFTLKRYGLLLEELNKKIDHSIVEPGSDAFVAALKISLDALMETVGTEKAKHFASVLAGTWNTPAPKWDEITQTLKLIRDLEEAHIRILHEGYQLHKESPYTRPSFAVGERGSYSCKRMDKLLPNIDPTLIALCVSDLIAKGLLNDSQAPDKPNIFDRPTLGDKGPAPLVYQISDLGKWFVEQLNELPSSTTSEG